MTGIGSDYFKTPQAYKDAEEKIATINILAHEGYFIDTEKRRDDWIAYLSNNKEVWEAGKTELEAIKKIAQTLMQNENR